ncbi:hypothetical protein BJ508DRAFT_219199 [Ascobolus immersus RN42]|uniref:NACHT domain-containing protein n=1 Tax=Ascobolus immersus RN42 TaxID=1160509 RepID=A0A3N4IQ40_ASCIM|nr:hypothetical protein BJ508DRAFT_219199 [Ascobolus immersus RN42]
MAEPLALIGLVSNIAQFTGYALEVFFEAKNIYSTGRSATTTNLLDINESPKWMEFLMKQVEASVEGCGGNNGGQLDSTPEKDLLSRYTVISTELSKVLQEATKDGKAKNQIVRSIQVALHGYKNKERIANLRSKLESLKNDVDTRSIYLVRINQTTIMSQLLEIREISNRASSRMIGQMALQKDSTQNMGNRLEACFKSLNKKLDSMHLIDGSKEICDGMRALWLKPNSSSELSDLASSALHLKWQAHILRSLQYEVMHDRKESIREQHTETLKWIFEDTHAGLKVGLSTWLQNESKTFWITGKAGSGKSTLMKYICSQPNTIDLLRRWAGKLPLIFASHYFWISGSPVQKSLAGLYRALLHQIIFQRAELLELCECFGRRKPFTGTVRTTTANDDDESKKTTTGWSLRQLEEALGEVCRAASGTSGAPFKLCLVIDGLDEYDNEGEHSDIIFVMAKLCAFENVKLCVSSRPWSKFEKAYGDNPAVPYLRLEDFTMQDMRIYTTKTLAEGSHEFAQLRSEDPSMHGHIIDTITKKSEGVWLWVYLVNRNILRDLLSDEITVSDIEKEVEKYPSGIDDYMRGLLQRGEPRFQEEGARIMLAVTLAEGCFLPALGVKFLLDNMELRQQMEAVLERRTTFSVTSLSTEDWRKLIRPIRQKMNNRCKDLLDIQHKGDPQHPLDSRAVFIHRCVADFFQDHYIDTLFKHAQKTSPFYPRLFLAAMYVHCIRSSMTYYNFRMPNIERNFQSSFCSFAFNRSIYRFLQVAELIDKSILEAQDCTPSSKQKEYDQALPAEAQSCYYTLVDEVRNLITTALIAFGVLRFNDSPLPIEAVLFARFALAGGLKAYVKALVMSDKSILQLHPRLICYAVLPLSLAHYLTSDVVDDEYNEPSNEGLYSSHLLFFNAYVSCHPGEIRSWPSPSSSFVLFSRRHSSTTPAFYSNQPDCSLISFLIEQSDNDILNISAPVDLAWTIDAASLDLRRSRDAFFSSEWNSIRSHLERRGTTLDKDLFPPNSGKARLVLQPDTVWSFFLTGLLFETSGAVSDQQNGFDQEYISVAALLLRNGAQKDLRIMDPLCLQASQKVGGYGIFKPVENGISGKARRTRLLYRLKGRVTGTSSTP